MSIEYIAIRLYNKEKTPQLTENEKIIEWGNRQYVIPKSSPFRDHHIQFENIRVVTEVDKVTAPQDTSVKTRKIVYHNEVVEYYFHPIRTPDGSLFLEYAYEVNPTTQRKLYNQIVAFEKAQNQNNS